MKALFMSVGFAAAVWSGLLGPARTEINTLHARIAQANAELERRRAAASSLPHLERDVRDLERELDSVKAAAETPAQDAITHIQAAADSSRVRISALRPRAESAVRGGGEAVEVGMEGSFHDLGRFLSRLAAAPRVMTTSDVSVRRRPATQGRAATVTAAATVRVFSLVSAVTKDEELEYDEGGRRDPFAALEEEEEEEEESTPPANQSGTSAARGITLAATTLSEVVVRGIAVDGTSTFAILETSRGRSFNVRALDRLADSVVHDISSSGVVFVRSEKDEVSLPIHKRDREVAEHR